MTHFRLALMVTFVLSILGCATNSVVEPTVTSSPTASQQMIASPTEISTLVPTSTKRNTPQPTLAPTSTATATPMPITDVRYQLITIESILPPEIEGTLVMGWSSYNDNEDYLLNIENGEKITVPKRLKTTLISPDRKLLAYIDWYTDQLKILTADGKLAFSYPVLDEWDYILNWIDSERLAIVDAYSFGDSFQIIFNVYNGEWYELIPTYPHETTDGDLFWIDPPEFDEEEALYDSTLTRAILYRNSPDNPGPTLELWDHNSEQVLWGKNELYLQGRPFWSPDDEYFTAVYMLQAEQPEDYPFTDPTTISLYLVNRDGYETKLTNNVMGGATWSPDGRFLATLWQMDLEIDGFVQGITALAIVDLQERKLDVYTFWSGSSYPIWSPDGKYVAFDNILSVDEIDAREFEVKTQVVIIDVFENRAYEVAKDANVVGWMIQSP